MSARRRTGRIRRVVGMLALTAVLVAPPLLLLAFTGAPWPVGRTTADIADAWRRGVADSVVVDALALIIWVTWLRFVIAVAVALASMLRGRAHPRAPRAGIHQLATGLVAVALGIAPAAAGAMPATGFATVDERPAVPTAARPDPPRTSTGAIASSIVAVVPGTPLSAAATTIEVVPGDTLSSIAHDVFGAASEWPVIWEANRGVVFDGRRFDDPDLILPGWTLSVPEDPAEAAAGDAVRSSGVSPPSGSETEVEVARLRADGPLRPVADVCRTTTGDLPGRSASTPTSRATVDASSPARVPGAGLLGMTMLGTGAAGLLLSRRTAWLSRTRRMPAVETLEPEVVAIERIVRQVADGERLARVEMAVREAWHHLAGCGSSARLIAVESRPDGTVRLHLAGPCPPPPRSFGAPERGIWEVGAEVATELIGSGRRFAAFPAPALVQVGTSSTADVYVDVEAAGLLTVDQSIGSDAVVRSLRSTAQLSTFGPGIAVVTVGSGDGVIDSGRPVEVVADLDAALDRAAGCLAGVLGVLPPGTATGGLRQQSAGETWDPVVVFCAEEVTAAELAELCRLAHPTGRGLGMVVTAPAPGPGEHRPGLRLAAGAEGGWRLEPLGIRLDPCALDRPTSDGLLRLLAPMPLEQPVSPAPPELPVPPGPPTQSEPHVSSTLPVEGAEQRASVGGADVVTGRVLIRLLGPLDVVASDGSRVEFDRRRSLELVAWLACHREAATRAGARAALWDHPVQPATFANVLSDARRSLLSVVPLPVGREWISRSTGERLELDRAAMTDVDLLERPTAAVASGRNTDEAAAELRRLLGHVRGAPFGATATGWADAEGLVARATLVAVDAALALAEHALGAGDVSTALWATERGLAVLPGHEELLATRLRIHGERGDLASLRAEWSAYERMLEADPWSDQDPADELLAIRSRYLVRR